MKNIYIKLYSNDHDISTFGDGYHIKLEKIYTPIEDIQVNINNKEIVDEILKKYHSLSNKWARFMGTYKENNKNFFSNDIYIGVNEFLELFKDTQTLKHIKNHINLEHYAKTDKLICIAFPLPSKTFVEVRLSIIKDTMQVDNIVYPIYCPTEYIYKTPDNENKGKELISICKNNSKLVHSTSSVVMYNFIDYEVISFKYNNFIKVFSSYSDFKTLCENIKLKDYENKQELISVDFMIAK